MNRAALHLYRLARRKEPPAYLKQHSMLFLVWKLIRKTLNVSIIPFIPLTSLRIILYRLVGYKIGKNVFIGMMCYLDDSYPQCITIEDNATISYRVTFITHGKQQDNSFKHKPIMLKRSAYIGACAVILPGVTIGSDAIVGAGSVVTKDVPEGVVVAGVPATILKS